VRAGNRPVGWGDYPDMNCDICREAISARLDGETPGAPDDLIDTHLRSCAGCQNWATAAGELHRATRVRAAEWGPDLTAPILARIDAEDKPPESTGRRRLADIRVGLAIVALLQLVLAVPPLLLGAEAGASIHVARELGSFDAALAVGFLVCAWQPARVAGLFPVAAALAVCMTGAALLDVATGRAPAATEAQHLLDLVGVVLIWLAARSTRTPGLGGGWRGAVLGR
jgi:predicted anti-sigma-YlaC factor YlaD